MSHDLEIGSEAMIRELVASLFNVRYPDMDDPHAEAEHFISALKIAKLEICHFPEGHHDDRDEGAINIAIGTENNNVLVKFGKKIAWIGFDKKSAQGFIEKLRFHTSKLK